MIPEFRPRCLLVVVAAVTVLMSARPLRADGPFKADGFAGKHDLSSVMPNEHVDPLSGNLLVTATDLVLPGNAGLDLVVTRYYGSQIFPEYEESASMTLEEDQWAGLGWRLHWGRILNADSQTPGTAVVELPGGGGGTLYSNTTFVPDWMTKGFARYKRNSYELHLPNGRVYTFAHLVGTAAMSPRFGTHFRTASSSNTSPRLGSPAPCSGSAST